MSIPRKTATGLSEFTSANGKSMNKTKMGNCKDMFKAAYSKKLGGYNTGLTEPWVDPETGLQRRDSDDRPMILQDMMEKKWNLPKGYLSNRPWRPDDGYNNLTYFQSKYWILNDGSTVLDLENMDDEIFYYVAKASPLIANSEREWRSHKWPKAQWYIALENESDDIKYQRIQLKDKAIALLQAENFTDHYKRMFVDILNLTSSRNVLTSSQVYNTLHEFIDKTTFGQNSNISKFNALATKLDSADGRAELEMQHLLKRAIDARVVQERQGTYTFLRPHSSNLVIGQRYSEAIDFLLNPKKQSEVEELIEILENKK